MKSNNNEMIQTEEILLTLQHLYNTGLCFNIILSAASFFAGIDLVVFSACRDLGPILFTNLTALGVLLIIFGVYRFGSSLVGLTDK